MLMKGALNGSRTRVEHPAIPITPAELAKEAAESVAAGAGALHVHVRDSAGQESLASDDVACTLEAIRAACPGIPVGISTAAWIVPDLRQRLALCNEWEVLPDFVSVNVHEGGAFQLIKLLHDKGVGIEAGIWNAQAAEALIRSGMTDACLRILIEPAEQSINPLGTFEQIEMRLSDVPCPRLLHGAGATAWTFVALAAQLQYDTRTGLEDTLTFPDGSTANNNAGLVAAGMKLIDATRTRVDR